jgi:hypothetical protein
MERVTMMHLFRMLYYKNKLERKSSGSVTMKQTAGVAKGDFHPLLHAKTEIV